MRIHYKYFLVTLCCALTAQISLHSQTMWPGDVNNNGRVTAVDLLYLGVAYGNFGPDRPDASTLWQGQDVALWPTDFANGLNYAYADVDGDGFIGDNDFGGGIKKNFGLSHGDYTGDGYENGIVGIHPQLRLNPASNEVAPGTQVDVDIFLGSPTNPVPEFYGIAFQLSYDETYIANPNGFQFELSPNSWLDETGGLESQQIVHDVESGKLEIAFTKTNHEVIFGGFGEIGTLSIIIENIGGYIPADTIVISVDSVKLVTGAELETYPIALSSAMMVVSSDPTNVNPPPNCPDVVAPVCGNNGVTYLNSCYAEADGVTFYTEGVCYSDCIDPNEMNPTANCPNDYDPVCGCNGVTYTNACRADAAGVIYYSSGQCPPSTCYDPYLVVSSGFTEVDDDTGIIIPQCIDDDDPVCGCDGITYPNPCLAEASGISFYSFGGCGQCIDPDLMTPDTLCPIIYDPVCGCNGTTYLNECLAEAAGVTSVSFGPCLGNSPWCSKAVPIQCGDFLPYETTFGETNDISNYPACLNTSLEGPEKVYVLNKTTLGDLQIGLEITTPGLDLDIFLLGDNCNQVTCLASSTTSNGLTNNEGILYPDAPLGIYYIIVDGQFPNSAGNYRLEVSCGYLDCDPTVLLDCDVPYSGTNIDGNDDVSLYQCGSVLNVENNGPEVVHSFTIISPGQVEINLSDLTADLELFLLSDCDASSCIKFSQNPGLNGEYINIYLAAGTYYVVVDGYNGAISDYVLTVSCSASCNLDINLASNNASCGQSDGSININALGGTIPYLISWNGPVTGSLTSYSNTSTIPDLPAGSYSISVTDANGCSDVETISLFDSGNLNAQLTPIHASCANMGMGKLMVDFFSGQAPYHVIITGPSGKNQIINTSSHTFSNLNAGNYTFYVIDANGCSYSQSFVINQTNGLDFTAIVTNASCGQYGSITVTFNNGTAPYWVIIAGPVTNSYFTYNNSITVNNLPGGVYDIIVEDDNWCQGNQQVIIETDVLDACAHVFNGVCNQSNAVSININGGTPPFDISWSGPVSGNASTNNQAYLIQNLPNGTYSINITDASGCADYELVTVNNSGDSLDMEVTGGGGVCGGLGFIWIDVLNGTPPYSVNWTGPSSGSFQSPTAGFDITNLETGCYFVTVTDVFGCSASESICITNEPDLNFIATPNNGSCGQDGSITLNIFNGTPSFLISWDGPVSGTAVSTLGNYQINNLPAGNYTIFITDGAGCSEFQYVTISAAGNMTLTTTPNAGGCIGFGSISVNISGGVGPYSISWAGPSFGSTLTGSNQIDIPNLPSGVYTISVFDSGNCYAMSTTTLNNGGGGVSVSANALNSNCSPFGDIEVWLSGSNPPVTISWSGPVNGFATIQNDNYLIQNLPTGNYSISVIDNNGCTDSQSVFLNNSAGISLSSSINNGTCGQNGSIDLFFANGVYPIAISWTGPTSGNTTVFTDQFTIPNLISGNYLINVLDNNGCSDAQNLLVNNGLVTSLISTPVNGTCGQNGAVDVFLSNVAFPVNLSWSGTSSGNVTINSSSYSIQNLSSGVYSISAIDNNGCFASQSTSLDNGIPATITATAMNGSCGQNGSIDVTVSGTSGQKTITWTGPVSGSTTINNSFLLIPNLPSGNYSISITDLSGCTASQGVTLTNGNNLNLSVTPTNGNCEQLASIYLSISNGSVPFSLNWSGPSSGSVTINSFDYTIPDLIAGTYLITVDDALNCSANTSTSVDVSSSPIASVIATDALCDGASNGIATAQAIDGLPPYSYLWNTGQTTQSISNLPSGNYSVTVTDANLCTSVASADITSTLPVTIDVITTNVLCYGDATGSIEVTGWGGTPLFTYEWSTGITFTEPTPNAGSKISGLIAGDYTVTITDENGCFTVATLPISQPDSLELTASVEDAFCNTATGSATVFPEGGTAPYSYLWDNGQTGQTIEDVLPGNYSVVVTDSYFCTETIAVTIDSDNQMPEADFSESINILTVDFTDLSDGTPNSYNWEFGDGGISDEPNPSYQFCEPGSYEVCLTITNDCGSDTYCKTIDIVIPSDVVILDVGESVGISGASIAVPITIDQLHLLVSLNGTLELANQAIANITGLIPGVISPSYGAANNTFSFFDSSGAGISVGSGDILFYVSVDILGNPGEETDILIVDSPLGIEVGGIVNGTPTIIDHAVLKGNISIPHSATINGSIFTFEDEPVAKGLVDVHDGAQFAENYKTDIDGYYEINNVPLGNQYFIEPSKDTFPGNGLSTFALFIGQQFILGKNPPAVWSPYQVIAGDVNCNDSFTTFDLFLIQQLILGTADEFADCPSWVFVPEHHNFIAPFNAFNVFPYPTVDTLILDSDTSRNFVGVKKGDILGQADPEQLTGNDTDDRNTDILNLVTHNAKVEAGESVEFTFSSNNFDSIVSLQFALTFNNDKLELESFEGAALNDAAMGQPNDNELRVSWFDLNGEAVSLDSTVALFKIKLKALEKIEDFSGLFEMGTMGFNTVAHNIDFEELEIELEIGDYITGTQTEFLAQFILHQNIPNPFKETTLIKFELPHRAEVDLIIQNTIGERVKVIQGEFESGMHEILLEYPNLSSGIYFYTLKSGNYHTTRKMIKF